MNKINLLLGDIENYINNIAFVLPRGVRRNEASKELQKQMLEIEDWCRKVHGKIKDIERTIKEME